ncbi:uncharacterized protein H6S33_006419 [Morchella sextelata]|uniref:uncharacterized protein n=1 Tax=Morchella sextelata TaxID=1174677 RepID=UPI001D036D02|nr:uncharacterized protein H6S33_006419 [Morchella sextelata]KAH0604751.1 hypothetical protein H6S33_006419 [Morchella sextelata]
MDRALDDVVRERSKRGNNNGGNNGGNGTGNGNRSRRRTDRRGGVRKTGNPRGYSDSLAWVHDKYEGDASGGEVFRRGGSADARFSSETGRIAPGSGKLRVENIHYELGRDDLMELFERQGIVTKLELQYDRAGRSEGTAFVTYEREEDAKRAVAEFDGANANGQPIRLTFVKPVSTSKSLFDRIKAPSLDERSSSEPMRRGGSGRREAKSSPGPDVRRDPTRRPTPPGIDRYVPPERRRERARADEPLRGGERNRGGRDGGRNNNNSARKENPRTGAGNGRTRKTVEELDEEMNNYFAEAGAETPIPAVNTHISAPAADEDEEMIL